jgi:hypothetical protein
MALAEVGRFKEAVEYVQKAAKALYEAAREVFERVKVAVQRLVELFVEAVTRVLAWIDEHKAYFFLMAAAAAGAVALSAALNLWGLVELEKLAYAASLTPFIPVGVEKYSREEAFKVLREAPDPYERFKEIAKAAIAKNEKLAEPWESLRMLIMPRTSEKKRLMMGKAYGKLDERKKKALFYAVLALEEAFAVYRSALRKYAEGLREVVQRVEVGVEPFKRVVYATDLGKLRQQAEKEEEALGDALRILREKLNEYAHRYGVGDLNVEEGKARELAEAKQAELSELGGVSFGVKALAALIAYREYALGRRSAFGTAAWYWLEEGGSAWLLYYAPITAQDKAKKARAEKPAAVEEIVAEALRRLFLKPGADHYSRFIEELTKVGKLALMLEEEAKSKKTDSYVFRLYKLEEGGGLMDLGIELRISKIEEGESIIYSLFFYVERWWDFFRQELEMAVKAAEVVRERLPVEDLFTYMAGWVGSDVAITRNKKGERVLLMATTHQWQLAETYALFGWSVVELRMTLTLEGPKLAVVVEVPLEKLDEAIRRSAESGWLKMLGVKAESWDGLKWWVAERWSEVINAVERRLKDVEAGFGFDLAKALEELKGLKSKLNDNKIAREVVAPALLLIQAEKLGVNEETLRYFGAVVSGAIDGDGSVSAAMKRVDLVSGERVVALLWAAALAAHGIKTKVSDAGSKSRVIMWGSDTARLASLYFLYGAPLLEGDERVINHKLAGAVELAAEGLNVSWEGLRRRTEGSPVAADLIISAGGAAVKYNVYLRDKVELHFKSTDRSRVELAARLLKLAGVNVEVKRKEDGRDKWYIYAYADMLAAGREELRKATAEIIEKARNEGWVDAGKAERWLKKLEKGRVLMEGWPKYKVMLTRSGALEVRFGSTNPDSIKREAQRLRDMGLIEGRHFTVKMPENGEMGYVFILKEGLAYAAWLSVYGSKTQRELAEAFIKHILKRAEEAGDEVRKKAEEIVKEGRARRSQTLENIEVEVEVGGKKYKVKVKDGEAVEEDRGGRKLLRIKITAEVGRVEGEHIMDRVERKYTITYSRHARSNAAEGYAVARTDPDCREADAERFSALIKALTGKEPKVYRRSNGKIEIKCYEGHLEGFMHYVELAGAIEEWLEETRR